MSRTPLELTNRKSELETVLITGANGSLGSTLVEAFLGADCTVVGLDIDVDEDAEVAADSERDDLYWHHVDATDSESLSAAVHAVEAEFDAIDAVVHCAGGFRWSHIEDVSDEDLEFLVETNLRSSLMLVREVLPGMRENGFGRIILMSTKSTLNPGVGEGPYASTKAGLNALTKSVASEVKEEEITINAVLPSVIDTETNREEMPEADFEKWVGRDQLAEIIFRLTQSFGDPINGALLPVAGKM